MPFSKLYFWSISHRACGGVGRLDVYKRQGKCKPGLARLATASSLDTAKVSALQANLWLLQIEEREAKAINAA